MAVYTPVSIEEARGLAARYALGGLNGLEPILQGVENTNYFFETDCGRYVLTLFEKRVNAADLPFFIGLMEHLARRSIPAPTPLRDASGAPLQHVAGRPAILATCLPGAQRMQPEAEDCRTLGEALARLHAAAQSYPMRRANALGLEGWRRLAAQTAQSADRCERGLAVLIAEELAFLAENWPTRLPQGVIHADLFPDNVFFEAQRISGIIDFYFACNDFLAYDLAICLNAWASERGQWAQAKAAALVEGYEGVRALSEAERRAMPVLLRGAALRFLLTRLADWLHQADSALVETKDPLEYRDLLLRHRRNAASRLYGCADD